MRPAAPRPESEPRLRRAEAADVDFLVDLFGDAEVEPFLAARTVRDRAGLLAEVERSAREPGTFGRFVIDVGGEPAGSLGFECVNERSRIARLSLLAVHPAQRGRRLADAAARRIQHELLVELGYHRLELEIYGFNERAQRHAERSGFVREGVKRRAYLRDGGWADGVLYSLVWEDLEPDAGDVLRRCVALHNHGVRTGAWEPLVTLFAADSRFALEGIRGGSFEGRDAILAAYRERPPDDTVELREPPRVEGDTVYAAFAWSAAPAVPAGELRATVRAAELTRLVVAIAG